MDQQHDNGTPILNTPLFRLTSAMADGDTAEVFVGDLKDILSLCPADDKTVKKVRQDAIGKPGAKITVFSADLKTVIAMAIAPPPAADKKPS